MKLIERIDAGVRPGAIEWLIADLHGPEAGAALTEDVEHGLVADEGSFARGQPELVERALEDRL